MNLNNFIGIGKKIIRDAFGAGRVTFKVMFARFRQVLENHNRAVEIIADMGDKLGGDYIFDVTYIRSAYSGLYATLADSLVSFDVLTRNKYPRLKDVLGRIDREIRLLVYKDGDSDYLSNGEFVLPYSAITGNMSYETGGKNANLAELKNNLVLNIPDAFAVTVFAYDEFIRHNRINEMISALGGEGIDTKAALNEIHASILRGSIPSGLESALDNAISMLRAKYGDKGFIAVRSSAQAEDREFSFAGQFDSVLNVPFESGAVHEAYKRVVASLFSEKAGVYHKQLGIDIRSVKMAVACVVMVDADISGVIYSANPGGDHNTMIINATWGLGASVVEGQTDADFYQVRKDPVPAIISARTGKKDTMILSREDSGTTAIKTPADRAGKSSLSEDQVLELARQAMLIENYFRQPQDIEWAIDRAGKIFILQARPLRIASSVRPESPGISPEVGYAEARQASSSPAPGGQAILMKARGQVVQKGAGAGKVFIFKHIGGLESFSRGDILVARNDSSDFIRVMPYASAIITDTGSLTSHMASLCREFRVPAFVNAGNATQVLKHGQEITVAFEDAATIYAGILRDVLEQARSGLASMEDVYEFRKKRYILRYISPLNLIDPLIDSFTPEGCKTMHDILRFIHEKAVMELIDNAMLGLKGQAAMKLDLPIPTGIIVVDIGGGLLNSGESSGGSVAFEQVASIPLRAVLRGMMHPGAWQSAPVALKVNDFMSSMMRMPDITSGSDSYAGNNVAVVSEEYLNLSLRFGYHFNMIDCYCSETARNNHIYFRFTGGATDMIKRSRRIELISIILKEYGFNTQSKGDLIIGRLANMGREDLEKLLDSIGRLIAFTRQLDAVLHDDSKVQLYAKNFLEGKYEL
ncbi:MAG: PEP/pyruvate-binding domain-containing protein [Dissulfurispiraceae bacterium]|jgi:pyruvate,water dikinase